MRIEKQKGMSRLVIFHHTIWRVGRETGVDRPGIWPGGHTADDHPRTSQKGDYKCAFGEQASLIFSAYA